MERFISVLVALISIIASSYAYEFNCSQGDLVCKGDIACLIRYYTCCPSSSITRGVDCSLCGGNWTGSKCLSGEEPEETAEDPPTNKEVGMWKKDIQEAPVSITHNKLEVRFFYSNPVVVLVGISDSGFQSTWWLNSDCRLTSSFSALLNNSTELKVCRDIELPTSSGWIFWLVAPGSVNSINFDTGPYNLYFYAF